MPLEPKLLNYVDTQFLIIGHNDDALEKAAKPQDGEDEKAEAPLREIEKLEHEDEIRVEHLKGLTFLEMSLDTEPTLSLLRGQCYFHGFRVECRGVSKAADDMVI